MDSATWTALEEQPLDVNIRAVSLGTSASAHGSGCHITRQSNNKILKSGSRVRIEEAEALKLAHGLQLPVPRVYEVCSSTDGAQISMDLIDGESLESVWPSMSVEQKKNIAQQLREIVSTMRSAPQAQFTIGACGGSARDCRRYSEYTGGPFETEADFNKFVLDLYRVTPTAIRNALAQSLLTDHRIVFTHGDLTPHNVIVADGRIKALIDWEFAGWYPEYWEYVKFFERGTKCGDWKDFANEIFDQPYSDELVTFQAIARWQKP